MKVYRAKTSIAAAPEVIWSILTDAPSYPEWDPGAERIEGRIALGEQITAYTKLSPGRAFPVKVTEFVPAQKMVWASRMPLGVFKAERTFALSPRPDGTTDFTVEEVFSGLLLPLIGRSIPDLGSSFEQFAAGLKARAENSGR